MSVSSDLEAISLTLVVPSLLPSCPWLHTYAPIRVRPLYEHFLSHVTLEDFNKSSQNEFRGFGEPSCDARRESLFLQGRASRCRLARAFAMAQLLLRQIALHKKERSKCNNGIDRWILARC